MKKLLYRVLLISLFMLILFVTKSYCSTEFLYTVDENEKATITAYIGTESDLVIPSKVDGYEVIGIGNHAFDVSRNSTNGNIIKNVVISEGIEKIGLLAFAKCENLETVELPESLTFIDLQAFLQSSKLKFINIPSNITTIPGNAFQGTGLVEIEIPKNVKKIGTRAFASCNNLKKVTILNDEISFYTILQQFRLPDGTIEYNYKKDNEVFYNCSSDLVLYGNNGSETQKYANNNSIKFKLLSGEEDPVEGPDPIPQPEPSPEPQPQPEPEPTPEPSIVLIDSISLNKNEISLYVGETENLIATIKPDNATDKTVIWTSSNKDIVSVEDGKVTAKAIGNATINVANKDNTVKASCNVEVKKKEEPSKDPVSNIVDNTIDSIDNNIINNTIISNIIDNTVKKSSDNTIANSVIPQTGDELKFIIIPILIIGVISAIIYWRVSLYKEIK